MGLASRIECRCAAKRDVAVANLHVHGDGVGNGVIRELAVAGHVLAIGGSYHSIHGVFECNIHRRLRLCCNHKVKMNRPCAVGEKVKAPREGSGESLKVVVIVSHPRGAGQCDLRCAVVHNLRRLFLLAGGEEQYCQDDKCNSFHSVLLFDFTHFKTFHFGHRKGVTAVAKVVEADDDVILAEEHPLCAASFHFPDGIGLNGVALIAGNDDVVLVHRYLRGDGPCRQFCGGGPGVGPICCTAELAPYLPGHPEENCIAHSCKLAGGTKGTDAVSSALYGNPLLLPITHAYIKLLGAEGLKASSEVAILNANYIAEALKNEFPTVYSGATGRVAHECLLDCRDFMKRFGVGSTDIAKRLMDFGFHAPTLSFPVHETLMVEPTESEPKEEMDRFIEAMKTIKAECEKIAAGEFDPKDNPVANAPHPAHECCADTWNHPYSRELAAYPLEWIRENKFWPAVSRVDDGYGDRNLVCTCN